MRVVFDILPHEEADYVKINGPYWTQEMATALLSTDKIPVLRHYDPVSLRRMADGWWIVGKPLPDNVVMVGNQRKGSFA